MKRLKTIVAIGLVLALVFPCLVACDLGGNSNETTVPISNATPSTENVPEGTTDDVVAFVDITTAVVTTSPEATTAAEVTTVPEVTTAPEATTVQDITTAPEVTIPAIPVVTEPAHTHSFSADWKSDGTSHWHECSCGEKTDRDAHKFGYRTVTKQETCTSEGETESFCEICGYKKTDTIEKLSHTPVLISGSEATCTQPGKTDGSKCNVCGTVLVAQDTIPALGHDYAETVVPPSKDREGYTRHDCVRCGDAYNDNYVPATGSLGLEFIDNGDGTCTIVGIGTCTDEDLYIPSVIEGLIVTSIGVSAFTEQTSLNYVFLPDTITAIERRAFYGCSNLKEMYISKSVSRIDSQAFFKSGIEKITFCAESCSQPYGSSLFCDLGLKTLIFNATNVPMFFCIDCKELEEVVFSDNTRSIRSKAFSGCTALSQLTFSEGITKIENSAFEGCTSLSVLSLPDSITEIGVSTFKGCSGLTGLSIPKGLTALSGAVFSGCSGLKEISIPSNITTIGGSAFEGCSGLTNIEIPDTVTLIGENAFRGCTGLKSASMTRSVTRLGTGVFAQCTSLESFIIPDSITTIAYWTFQDCTSLKSVVIPDSVTSINQEAFQGCSSLMAVVIPDSVSSVESYAFKDCENIAELILPNSVKRIGSYAFQNCSSLNSIVFSGTVSEFNSMTFGMLWDSGTGNYTVQCKDGSIEKTN